MMKKYLVGGAVRDKLLNLPINEKDWVVVGATPKMLKEKGFNQVGKDFPVFLHPQTKEEYALARTERKSGKGYTGFICDIDQSITLEQDLMRRDLTINAIAMDEEQQLIDPYHGIDDIEKRILRHVSAAFKEDPLRVLRVARFAARFHHLGFTISSETLSLMIEIVADGEMAQLTPERVWRETEKALSTDDPQVYFDVLKICGALVVLFPELDGLFHVTPVQQPLSYSVSLGERALLALKQASRLTTDLPTRFAILCHRMSVAQINQCCLRLKAPNEYKKVANMVSQYHAQIEYIELMSAKEIILLLDGIDVWRQPRNLQPLILNHLAKADETQKESFERQTIYLQQAYSIANSVSVQQIIAAGFRGEAIKHELAQLRIKVINEWKNVKI